MYADDMVLFSESIVGLQQMLDSLYTYTKKWSLCVNTDKTKILVFRNRGKIKSDEKWNYCNCNLEIVDSFCYLGLMLYYNGNFNAHKSSFPVKVWKPCIPSYLIQRNIIWMFLQMRKYMSNIVKDCYLSKTVQQVHLYIWWQVVYHCIHPEKLECSNICSNYWTRTIVF
jgi:hypothetical protein